MGYKDPPKEHQFKKGQSGNPTGKNAGRPPKIFTKINRILSDEKQPQMGLNDYKKLFRILLECTPDEIKKLLDSKELDNYSLYIASALREAMKKGNLFLHRELIETILKEDDEKDSTEIIVHFGFDVGDKHAPPEPGQNESENGSNED